ncbi:MAG: COG2426 family protein [Christensenellales bacterium]|jgi:uncharacterized membrane protein
MTDNIIKFFQELVDNDYLTIIIISILPIIELRGSIPVAFSMGMHPLVAFIVAVFGSSLIVPVLLLLLRPVLDALKKIKFISKIALSIEDILAKKAEKVIQKAEKSGRVINGELSSKYKFLGVLAFVAVPLPMTGAWTGSAVAAFLDMKFLPALVAVVLGNISAGIIMSLLCFFFIGYLDMILTVFLSVVVVILIGYVVVLIVKSMKKREEKK